MDYFFSYYGLLIIIGFAILIGLITFLYKKITGREMDFSRVTEEKKGDPSQAEEWLNDPRLTKRWQVASDLVKVNNGTAPVKNKEDRFHLTPSNEELSEKR